MSIGILVFPNVEELDFAAPWQLLGTWRAVARGPEHSLLVAQDHAATPCANGLSILPHVAFDDCPPLRYLLVPGGWGSRAAAANDDLLQFVARQAAGCEAVLSVCTGAFILHAAGLLGGRRATTHWSSLDRLRGLGDVDVVEERWVQDGRIWTSGGVSAGADMVLAFIAHVAGAEAAGRVQLAAEYYPSGERYGSATIHAQGPAYAREDRHA